MSESRSVVSPIDRHIGMRIRMRRKLLRRSQQSLADVLSVSFQQLQKYERGTNRASAASLWRIASELEVPLAYFFEGLSASEIEHAAPDLAIARLIQSADGVEFAQALAGLHDPLVRKSVLALLRTLTLNEAA